MLLLVLEQEVQVMVAHTHSHKQTTMVMDHFQVHQNLLDQAIISIINLNRISQITMDFQMASIQLLYHLLSINNFQIMDQHFHITHNQIHSSINNRHWWIHSNLVSMEIHINNLSQHRSHFSRLLHLNNSVNIWNQYKTNMLCKYFMWKFFLM